MTDDPDMTDFLKKRKRKKDAAGNLIEPPVYEDEDEDTPDKSEPVTGGS